MTSFSTDWSPLERELGVNIEYDDCAGMWFIYVYNDNGDRFDEECQLMATPDEIEQAARRVAAEKAASA